MYECTIAQLTQNLHDLDQEQNKSGLKITFTFQFNFFVLC